MELICPKCEASWVRSDIRPGAGRPKRPPHPCHPGPHPCHPGHKLPASERCWPPLVDPRQTSRGQDRLQERRHISDFRRARGVLHSPAVRKIGRLRSFTAERSSSAHKCGKRTSAPRSCGNFGSFRGDIFATACVRTFSRNLREDNVLGVFVRKLFRSLRGVIRCSFREDNFLGSFRSGRCVRAFATQRL